VKTIYAEKQQPKRDGRVEGLATDRQILGEPVSVVQRWASEGMPLRKEGRFVSTTPDELNSWLGKESGKPLHVATENTNLTAELKRGLSFVRHEGKPVPTRKERTPAKKP
jgi:hypothetical protein